MTTNRRSTGWRASTKDDSTEKEKAPRSPQANHPAPGYINENFEPADRLALVVINRSSGAVVQRLARAQSIAAEDTQKWLQYMNRNGYEIYISMNTLNEHAGGRTKQYIDAIRHIYLDLDQGGKEALDKLLVHPDLPQPNYVLTTSPEKYQVIWKVEGFSREYAENLQRGLARDLGADPAATDSSRVLRLPGFDNHKYDPAFAVEVESHAQQVYRPENFPQVQEVERDPYQVPNENQRHNRDMSHDPKHISQSERDWAYARRALSRGDSLESVIKAIASYRRFDKPNPEYYARHTVEKAFRSLQHPEREQSLEIRR
jgi:hypothetical protein